MNLSNSTMEDVEKPQQVRIDNTKWTTRRDWSESSITSLLAPGERNAKWEIIYITPDLSIPGITS